MTAVTETAVPPITVQGRKRDGWRAGVDGWNSKEAPHFTATLSAVTIHPPTIPEPTDPEVTAELDKLRSKVGALWLARLDANLQELRDEPSAQVRWAANSIIPATVRQTFHFTKDGQHCGYGPDATLEVAGYWLPPEWHRDNWLSGMAHKQAREHRQARQMIERSRAREEYLGNDLTHFQPTLRERQLLAWIRQELANDTYPEAS